MPFNCIRQRESFHLLCLGGILNYSATITSGEDVVSLRVVFSGLNELNEPNIMMISINGNVPTHAFGHQTEFPDHVADYGRVKKGNGSASSPKYTKCGSAIYTYRHLCKTQI